MVGAAEEPRPRRPDLLAIAAAVLTCCVGAIGCGASCSEPAAVGTEPDFAGRTASEWADVIAAYRAETLERPEETTDPTQPAAVALARVRDDPEFLPVLRWIRENDDRWFVRNYAITYAHFIEHGLSRAEPDSEERESTR